MKIVKRSKSCGFLFKCSHCGRMLEAEGVDFKLIKRGVVGYECPACRKEGQIKERKLKTVPLYESDD